MMIRISHFTLIRLNQPYEKSNASLPLREETTASFTLKNPLIKRISQRVAGLRITVSLPISDIAVLLSGGL